MFKNKLNLRKVIAIAICLAGSATMFAQNKAIRPFDRESFKNDKSVFAGKYPQAKSNSTLPALRSGNFKQRLDSMVVSNSLKCEYLYDGNGNCIAEINYDWEDNVWVEDWKSEYSYDNKGNLTMDISYNWESNAWVKDWKFEYLYDNNGNEMMRIGYSWKDNEWVESWKNEYSYDNNGNQTMYIRYNWENNAWVKSNKCEYSYDNNGNLTMEVGYHWENNEWVESLTKYKYTYNNGKISSRIEYYHGIEYTKKEYKYDEAGNCIMTLNYISDDRYYMKDEFEYDLSVPFSDICFIPLFNLFFEFDFADKQMANKLMVWKFYFDWSESLQTWQYEEVYMFYYSDVQSGSNVGIEDTRRAASLPRIAGYYSLTGAKLAQEPERGMYIILYDNGMSEKRVK